MSSFTSKFRRRAARPRPGDRVAITTMPLNSSFDAESCDCPICRALAELETEPMELDDGTLVHEMSAADFELVQRLIREQERRMYN